METSTAHRHFTGPFEFADRRACMEARLVLESVGIASQAYRHDGHWWLAVDSDEEVVAASELNAYEQEKADSPNRKNRSRIDLFGGAFVGIFVYSIVLCSFFLLADVSAYQIDWSSAGQMHAKKVVGGEWWRCTTALTLHVDGTHLVSNLAFGCVFGLLAGRILGGGVAWLTIVLAGSLGNAINAFVRDGGHLSIGASTAVFAALGIMVAHALRPRSANSEKWFKRWSPMIGGVLMLAMLGLGDERTDVLAHVTGFGSGIVVGWIGCRLPNRVLGSPMVQWYAGVAAIALIAATWTLAVFHT